LQVKIGGATGAVVVTVLLVVVVVKLRSRRMKAESVGINGALCARVGPFLYA
jgi:hypothetical protein